jgi:predicted metal-binding protein
MEKAIRRISLKRNEKQIEQDLKKYQGKALESGATKAEIIPASDIVVDERITMKCRIPRCFGYGTSPNCPPNAIKPSELRDMLTHYHHAVFFMKEVPTDVLVEAKNVRELFSAYKEIYRIVSEIESMAYYDGYYMAIGFAAGSCRFVFCGKSPDCPAMKGEACRFALKARSSMEAVGMDVFKMSAARGWDAFPIGVSTKADTIPFGSFAGIIIIE